MDCTTELVLGLGELVESDVVGVAVEDGRADDRVLEGASEVVGGVLETSLDEGWEGEAVDAGVLTGVVGVAEVVGCAEDSGLG